LAERRPVSKRIGQRLIHPDRNSMVSAVEFSEDGARIIGSTYPENNVQIWDADTGKQLLLINTPREYKSSDKFWEVTEDFSKMYTWVETRGDFERLKKDGKDGIKIAYPESGIQVWNLENGDLIEKIQADPPNQVRYLSISPNGKYMFSFENMSGTFFGDRKTIQRMMNVATGEWSTLDDGQTFNLVIDKHEKQIADFVNDDTQYTIGISLKEFPSFQEMQTINLPPGIHRGNSIRFTEDNKHVLAEFRTYERKNIWNKWKTTGAEVLDQIVSAIGSRHTLSAQSETGYQLVRSRKCISCHLPNLQSTKRAPDLCDVIESPGVDGIAATLQNGRISRGMPQFELNADEQKAVISFLHWMHNNRAEIRSEFVAISVQNAENARIPWFEYDK